VLLECAHCGAPLDVREGVQIVSCSYCRRKTERARLRTLAESTPVDFAPPRTWRPPTHVAAASDIELRFQAPVAVPAWPFVLVGLLAVGIPVVAMFAKSGAFSPPLSNFEKVDLAGTPVSVGKRLGGRPSDTALHIGVSHPEIATLYLVWDKDEPSHPHHVGTILKKGKRLDPAICTRLAVRLGELRGGSWGLGPVHVNCDPANNTLSGGASPPGKDEVPDDGRWKQAFVVVHRLLLAAILDHDSGVSDAEIQKSLGAGYALSDVAAIDVAADVDDAEAMLGKSLPGAVRSSNSNWEVRTTYARLPRARFDWENKKGGRISHVTFGTSDYGSLGSGQATLAKCLDKTLGRSDVSEVDHAKKKVNYIWNGSSIWLYESSLSLVRPSKETFRAVLKALEGCN